MWGKILTYPYNGSLYEYTVTDPSTATPVPPEEVITMDGWESPRLVILVNGTIPGPPIEVWENQLVRVHVKNRLHNEGISIHWHGLHQMNSPHMDGVPFVTQCPILPGQTFTYFFRAHPKGTFWYHSHMGSQRTMGFYGPLIVHERQSASPRMEELTWTITDWNHAYDSEVTFYKMIYGIYEGRTKYEGTKSLDGASFSLFRFHSGLLNGRGRYYDPSTGQHNGAPLSSFTVAPGHQYRVRVIAAGELYPFRISVDNHLITVVASDGYDLEPMTVESFVINPGERFDFILNATQPVGNYWIRGETLEVEVNHTLEAILHYHGAPTGVDPTTQRRQCSATDKCIVINCPFKYYPPQDHTLCVTFDQLRAASSVNFPAPTSPPSEFDELFMNFAFPGENWAPGSVNGRVFEAPGVAAMTQGSEVDTLCSEEECGEGKICKCTWAYNVEHGKTYQFVFLNMGKGKGWAHPIHLHGHSFHVIKMGFPNYNISTAKATTDNVDIDCRGNPDPTKTYCNSATWADPSWLHGNVPGVEIERAPLKDTLIVPSGGYAVVRIRGDNPGLWILHCHIQIHSMGGMAMLLNEAPSRIGPTPANFPECRGFVTYADSVETPSLGTHYPRSSPSTPFTSSMSSTSPTPSTSSTSSTSETSARAISSSTSSTEDDLYSSSVSGYPSGSISVDDSQYSASTPFSSPSPSTTSTYPSSSSPPSTTEVSTDASTSAPSTMRMSTPLCQTPTPEPCPPPEPTSPPPECTGYSVEVFWAVTGCLVIFITLLLIILMIYMCLHRTSGGRSKSYKLDSTHAYQNKGAAL
ncbi:uncharacterized protein LOC135470972 [Liolophura sinensis]|uniref:uncharacterized protein LOC135470972 n=1 Tax=Liolophura sinensis TaxID=3198878 RepID=UPI0031584E6D